MFWACSVICVSEYVCVGGVAIGRSHRLAVSKGDGRDLITRGVGAIPGLVRRTEVEGSNSLPAPMKSHPSIGTTVIKLEIQGCHMRLEC